MNLNFIKGRYFSNPIGDLLGGITTGIVALPMALAFGVASGLGAQAGLYGAMAAGILAAMFGGTPGQVTGPTGPMTVVVATIVASHLKDPSLIFATIILAGLLQIFFGIVRAGQLIHYVPYPVISGFMTGIGLIIIIIQIHPLVGLPTHGDIEGTFIYFLEIIQGFNHQAAFIGLLAIFLVYLIPFIFKKKIPPPLIALIVCSVVSVIYKMDIPRISGIPHGFPEIVFPHVTNLPDFHLIFPSALSLAILGSLDSLLTSLVMDRITGKRHKSDQELIGQGIGNIASGLIGGLPGAGATMRSLVNIKSGGTSYLSGIIHGLLLLAILLSLGPLISNVPLSCLAGILITVGISIIDYRGLKSIGGAPKGDVIAMITVLILTVFVDLMIAVVVGVTLSSLLFAKKLSDVQSSSHARLDSLEHLHKVSEDIPKDLRERIYIYTFNGPLYFGEVKNFNAALSRMKGIKYLIIKFYNVPIVDQSGIYALEDALEQFQKDGVKVSFVGMTILIKESLGNLGVLNKIPEDSYFDSFEEVIESIKYKKDVVQELKQ